MKKCYQVHPSDNVAVLLQNVVSESVEIINGTRPTVTVKQPIELGHKVAVAGIAVGEPVFKFGIPIGIATATIEIGDWVHLHNCRSQVDERSNTLDVHTGAAGDTVYE